MLVLLLAAACGASPAPLEHPEGDAAESPRAYGRALPDPPPGCRPLQVRAMPEPSFVEPVAQALADTQILTAAGRLVVMQHPQAGPARGEMFDPVSDRWTAVSEAGAPRFGSFDEGTGPLGSPRWFAFDVRNDLSVSDRVSVRSGRDGALHDAARPRDLAVDGGRRAQSAQSVRAARAHDANPRARKPRIDDGTAREKRALRR